MGQSIEIKGLGFSYRRKADAVLADFDLAIDAGERLSLVGPSGSGKSSLLRLIAGLERPTTGCIHLDGECISTTRKCLTPERRNIGLVSQGGDLFPHLTVGKNIAYGLFRWNRTKKKARVRELLEAIELPELEGRFPGELSGGEAQRVALARALAPNPGVLLLDEPFSSLDSQLRERLLQLTLSMLQNAGTTAIFVTHHEDDTASISSRVVRLRKTAPVPAN